MGVVSWFITWISLILSITDTSLGDSVELIQITKSTCDNQVAETNYLNDHASYQIMWNGIALPYFCKLSFFGGYPSDLNRYKICVKASNYYVNDCNFHLRYYVGFDLHATKDYSCFEDVPEFCAGEDKFLGVEFEGTRNSSSSITLMVTAIKTFEFDEEVHSVTNTVRIVFGVIGGIVFLAVVVGGLVYFVMYHKRHNAPHSHPIVVTSTTPGHATTINTAGISQGIQNYAYVSSTTGAYPTQPVLQNPTMVPSVPPPAYSPPPAYPDTNTK